VAFGTAAATAGTAVAKAMTTAAIIARAAVIAMVAVIPAPKDAGAADRLTDLSVAQEIS
jgi:hypothetical protein